MWTDWDPGGLILDLVGVCTFQRCILCLTSWVRQTFAGTTGQGLLPLFPAEIISTELLNYVDLMDSTVGLRMVVGHRSGQRSLWCQWYGYFYRVTMLRLQVGDPVAVCIV